jgi:RNA polymerase sigma-70 factor (ECF subfamily)
VVQSIAAGSSLDMQLLYARYSPQVYRFILRLTGNASVAEDLVSDVFLDVWKAARRFQARSEVSTWLLAIARHKAMSVLRNRVAEPLHERAAASLADPSQDPETIACAHDRSRVIRNCLAQLSSAHREVLDLAYYHGRSITEMSRILDVPESTVKTRMFYARAGMARLLTRAGIAGAA